MSAGVEEVNVSRLFGLPRSLVQTQSFFSHIQLNDDIFVYHYVIRSFLCRYKFVCMGQATMAILVLLWRLATIQCQERQKGKPPKLWSTPIRGLFREE